MPQDRTRPLPEAVTVPASRNGHNDGSGYGHRNGYGYGYGYGSYERHAGDFARTWHTLVEKAWVIGLSAALFIGMGVAYIKRAPVLYSSTTTIQAEQDQPNILKMQMVQLKDLQAVDYLQTVAESLTSRSLLERVADTNGLWTDQRFTNGFKTATARPVGANTNVDSGHLRALDSLEKMVRVKLRRGTRLIDITVTHRVPELTDLIANSIVNEYVNEGTEREDTTIGLAGKSLAKQTERLRKKLEESQAALQTYLEQNKASSLDERQNTVVAKLKELSTKATEANSIRIKTQTEYAQVTALRNNMEALMTVPSVAKDPTVMSLQLSLIKAEDDFAGLSQRYKDKHPKHVQARTQISELKADITNAVVNAVQILKASLDSARAAEGALNQAMQEQETSALELSKLSINYSVLAREVESDRALYDAVLKGMKEASVTKETQQTGIIRVVQPAYTPDLPVSPKKTLILAMSAMSGIFFGVMFVLGIRVSDTSIKTVDEAEMMLNLSVFSAVPQMREIKPGETPLVVVEKARSEGAEAFRTLRTSLATLGKVEDRRVFLITSAMPSEGKTFCSTNYAASLAQVGLKTLLIDADLRRPSVETALMGKSSQRAGLTDYLKGEKKFQEVVSETKIENLHFISAGATASNPAELLAKDGLREIIQEALTHYDRVVLDSAPINAVSDTLLTLKSVQTVCLVVRAAHTSSRYVQRCVQLLQGAQAPLSGIILNRMPRRRGAGAYYDYHYHGKYDKKGVYGTP